MPIALDQVGPAERSDLRNTIAVAAITLLVLLVAFLPAFEQPGGLMDEGMILVYPELLQHGKLPYRDFETFYGPGNPALLAGVFAAFGTNIFVERAVGLLYRVTILLGIFVVARNGGKTLATGCTLLAGCLLLGTGMSAYAWLGAMGCAVWSLWLGGRLPSNRRSFFAGLLAGCALLFRIDLGPAIILSALPLLHGMTKPQRRLYSLGAALALLPLLGLTAVIGREPVLSNLFLLPVLASNPGRHLPLFSTQPYLLNLFFAHCLAAMTTVTAGWVGLRSCPRFSGRLIFALGCFELGLTHQAIQRLDSIHLIFAAFLSLGILPLSLFTLWSHFQHSLPEKAQAWLAIILVVAILEAIAPELTIMVRSAFAAGFRTNTSASFAELHGRSFPFHSPRMTATVDQMLKKLDSLSAPGERLFVGPADLRRTNYNDTYIYHMIPKLTPASYFLEMNPLSANRPGSRLAADVGTADWLVLNRAWDSWDEPNHSVDYGPDAPNRVVQKQFELCGEFGGYLLFHRKG